MEQRGQGSAVAERQGAVTYRHVVTDLLPPTWRIYQFGIWVHCTPPASPMREAGWKVHVSVVPASAEDILRRVVPVLRTHTCAFKCAEGDFHLKRLNGKNWSRGGGGKFITVYPHSDEHFRAIVKDLHSATAEFVGPYVLSDRRYCDSQVLSYRYGAFKRRELVDDTGLTYPVFLGPDGQSYRDERLPYYSMPPWANDPLGLDHPPESEPVLGDGRFIVESAMTLKFSGGVYRARDALTGRSVVIKEARRHVHVAEPAMDAESLLSKEWALLGELSGLAVAPEPVLLFRQWENLFMVQELVEGESLYKFASRMPTGFKHEHNGTETFRAHVDAILAVFGNIANALAVLHARGIAFGDLSPGNVVVRPDHSVRLVDFEAACRTGVDVAPHIRTPGFGPPTFSEFGEPNLDLYSLGALMLHAFVPFVPISVLKPDFVTHAVARLNATLSLPEGFSNSILLLTGDRAHRPSAIAARDRLRAMKGTSPGQRTVSEGVEAKTMLRELTHFIRNRLEASRPQLSAPADRRAYSSHPLNVAYGLGGIAGVLAAVEPETPVLDQDWIIDSVRSINDKNCGVGHLTGMAGVANCLTALGMLREAELVLAQASRHRLVDARTDLFHGLAGVGTAHLVHYSHSNDDAQLSAALAIAERILRRSERGSNGLFWQAERNTPIGLGYGSSGMALFFLYLAAASGKETWLEHGKAALDFDVSAGERLASGTLGWRQAISASRTFYPYYESGSAGIGSVAARYHAVTGEERYHRVVAEIGDVAIGFCGHPGVLMGLAGRGHFLLDVRSFCPDLADPEQVAEVAAGLNLFAIQTSDGLAMPGDDLTAFSCDFATGSAGAIAFLHRMLTGASMSFLPDVLLAPYARPLEVVSAVEGTHVRSGG